MEYTYKQLEDDLAIGLEVHFSYKDEKYSISNNEGGWYLTKYSDPDNYQTFSRYYELLKNGIIDGKSLSEVWDDVKDVH